MMKINDYKDIEKRKLFIIILNICFVINLGFTIFFAPSYYTISFAILFAVINYEMFRMIKKTDKNLRNEKNLLFSCKNKLNSINNLLRIYMILLAFGLTFFPRIMESINKKSTTGLNYIIISVFILSLIFIMLMVLETYGLRCFVYEKKIVCFDTVMYIEDIKKHQLINLNNGKVNFEANSGDTYINLTLSREQSITIKNMLNK